MRRFLVAFAAACLLAAQFVVLHGLDHIDGTDGPTARSVAASIRPAQVRDARPRLLLSTTDLTRLQAKKNANDAAWLALKARADELAAYQIFPYSHANRTDEPANTIFYDYQGQGWFDAAMPLALAFQLTGDTKYSAKLIELADEMIAAQTRPANVPPIGEPPLRPDNYYGTRYLGPVIGIIYDWCYDQLGAVRRGQMLALMNTYFDDMRANAYQRNDYSDGNYFSGHLLAAATMGYASYGDNSRAQEMIDYARIRFDGTASALVASGDVPEDYFAQQFEGGVRPAVARDFNGPNVTGAPFKGGFDFQGWAYGTSTFNRIIDYGLTVKAATGEDILASRSTWFSQILRSQKHMLMPNHFEIDPSGDWGSDYGAVIIRGLPIRLAYVLAGTADGPGAQHFSTSEIASTSPYPEFPDYIYQSAYQPAAWESMLFDDATRPSSELTLPPYYSGFGPVYPQGSATNGAIPYFLMRSDWSASATWASLRMGAAWYDDHQHVNAGHLEIKHANDYLLIDASSWKGAAGSIGIVGSSLEEDYSASAVANTLYLDDFGDFQRTDQQFHGGQGHWGQDVIIAADQTAVLTYVRSDLSSAYNHNGDPADQAGRKLQSYYRSLLYLRSSNLFVTYDQVQVIASTNPRGPYRKQIRWHFPNQPFVSGKTVRVDQGASRLFLDVVLPATPSIVVRDESNNPDPCDGTVIACQPFNASGNSGTWRIEVGDASNPLSMPVLTVIQPGSTADPQMTTAALTTADSKMIGVRIDQVGAKTNVVLLNNQTGQTPEPITTTSYAFTGPGTAVHTLAGLVPSAAYSVTISASTVTVIMNGSGNVTASAAGVLQFSQTTAPESTPTPTPTATPTSTPGNGATATAQATTATAVATLIPAGTATPSATATNTAIASATAISTVAPTPLTTAAITLPNGLGTLFVPGDAGGGSSLQVTVRVIAPPTSPLTGVIAFRAIEITFNRTSDGSRVTDLERDVTIELSYAGLGLTNDQLSRLTIYNATRNEFLQTTLDPNRQVAIARTRRFSTFTVSLTSLPVPRANLPGVLSGRS